jgi:integrase
VPLSPTLLTALREYYRWMRLQTYLFLGTQDGWRADKPLTSKFVWDAVRFAAQILGGELGALVAILRAEHRLPFNESE